MLHAIGHWVYGQPSNAAAPDTISVSSVVMAACRVLHQH